MPKNSKNIYSPDELRQAKHFENLSFTCKQCIICTAKCDLSCGKCKYVFYCGQEHQIEHWTIHKFLCAKDNGASANAETERIKKMYVELGMDPSKIGNNLQWKLRPDSEPKTSRKGERKRVEVFYGRTDGEIGYKEYGAVIVLTNEIEKLSYSHDLYDPHPNCEYQILKEIADHDLKAFSADGQVPSSVDWIKDPMRKLILEKYKDEIEASLTKMGIKLEDIDFII